VGLELELGLFSVWLVSGSSRFILYVPLSLALSRRTRMKPRGVRKRKASDTRETYKY